MDRLPAEVGSTVELGDVLLVVGNGDVQVGRPTLEGARVIAEVVEHGREPKILVFKYKAKTRYRRRRGHRQGYTRLAVRQILTAVEPAEAEAKPKRRRARKAEPEAKVEAVAPVETPAPEAEAKPARRTRARKVKPEAKAEAATPEETPAPEAEAKPARRTSAGKVEAGEAAAAESKPARRVRKPAAKGGAEKPKRTRKKTESD